MAEHETNLLFEQYIRYQVVLVSLPIHRSVLRILSRRRLAAPTVVNEKQQAAEK